MCTIIMKVLFLGGLIVGSILTCIALATPHWLEYDSQASWGLFRNCSIPAREKDILCRGSWSERPAWRTAVAVILFLSLCFSCLAFAWWLLACIGCCWEKYLAPPLPMMAFILMLMNMTAVIVYAVWYSSDNYSAAPLAYKNSRWGYSFWCAVASIGCFAVTVAIGCGVVGLIKKGPAREEYRSI